MSRFVKPDTRVLTISDGDTLVVKKRLSNGETRAKYARMYHQGVISMQVNPLQTGLALVTAYLLDWSLRDDNGAPVNISNLVANNDVDGLERVLDSLSADDFGEIKEAIEKHEEEMRAERDSQKKTASGAPASSPTSSSPPASAGATSGSET